MNLRFLESFLWVARLGSFKAAAEKLHTTQAGISSRIATLEEQFGVRLFERDRHTVSLTYHGTELMPHAERMIEMQARMFGAVGKSENFSGMLRIGAIESVVHTWLPELLSRFVEAYPKVTVELHSDITPRLRDQLLRGGLDCAILSEEITAGFIINHRIANLDIRWITTPAMARQLPARRLSFPEVAAFPIISFHRESCVYRNIAQDASECSDLRVSYFSSLAAMIELTRAGFGVAPLPLAVIRKDLEAGTLVALDVNPVPAPLPLVASIRTEPTSPLSEVFVNMARTVCDAYLLKDMPVG